MVAGGRNGAQAQRAGTGLYAQVVDELGRKIVQGELAPGTIVYAEQLCEQLGVSRSVVREGVRTLSSMGLVEARPQVGTRVLAAERWDLLNPYVVAWRNDGPDYAQQMRDLLEFRLGVEHSAAGLAASPLDETGARQIMEEARAMEVAYRDGDARKFFDHDAEFHRLLLEGTKNVVIAQLADTISAALDARGRDTRPGMHTITEASVRNHLDLAEALAAGDVRQAQVKALELVTVTLEEFEAAHGAER